MTFFQAQTGIYFRVVCHQHGVDKLRCRKVGHNSYIQIEDDGYTGEETRRTTYSDFLIVPERNTDAQPTSLLAR